MATDSAELLERLHSHREVLCAYTTKVVVHSDSAATAEASAAQCIQALTRRGFGAALESSNTLDAWLGSLPAHGTADLRRDGIPSLNVADLLPVTGSWSGRATVPSRYFPEGSPALMWTVTEGATPFRLNLHSQDVFHSLILGPTGAGKSYLTAHLALQFLRYDGAQVFLFDKGYSSFLPTLAVGGVHYDIAAPRKACRAFQPLRHIDDEAERAWAVGWLDTLLRLQGLETRAAERTALERALALVATEEPSHRTLDALLIQLADPHIQGHLRPYCEGGSLERLLNGSSDPLADSSFLTFELGHILDADPRALVPVQLYLAHALAKRRGQARPTLLIWDEAWRALEDPYCRAWIKNDLATARKQNCGVVLITQSITQLVEPELRTLVDEAAQTKIYLPNPAAAKSETRPLYQALGLTERQCELLAHLTPKRQYLYASREGTRIFELGDTELAQALLSPPPNTTEEVLVDRIHAMAAEHGDGWPSVYLRQRGCERWADRLDALRADPRFSEETP
jgi:type IV secretion system protein VirB4